MDQKKQNRDDDLRDNPTINNPKAKNPAQPENMKRDEKSAKDGGGCGC